MKTLYLVRHAKSSWKFPDLDDFDRPLNKRGKRDAPLMGKFLKEHKILPEIIISSPAARAKKTAKIIAEALSYPDTDIKFNKEIYEASTIRLLKIAGLTKDKIDSAMLVGHNPGLTYLANMLTNVRIDNIPTCGVVCIVLDIPSWSKISENSGQLIFFEYPKKIISS